MKNALFFLAAILLLTVSCTDNQIQLNGDEPEPTPPAERVEPPLKRALWASINGRKDASYYPEYNNKILVSWRMFPTDDSSTGFDLYRKSGNEEEVKLNEEPITLSTNFQDITADRNKDNTYRLCFAGSDETLDTYTITAAQASAGLPYISIPLAGTTGISSEYYYDANDASVGDLDGDGVYEIVLKRLLRSSSSTEDEEDESGAVQMGPWHTTLLEAYKLDGSFLWRVALGPNVPVGNLTSFAVYDFDGDGKCEIAVRTAEGTVFGDGTEIKDTDGDGKVDYRVEGSAHIHGGPEFLSVLDGMTGRELARTDYIALGKSEDWGDNYYKRSASYRVGVGCFSGTTPSILICRGVYGKMVLEAWDFQGQELKKRWRFDTSDGVHGDYAGQGNHSLSVGDVDDDGGDEVVYGGCCIDHNGKGLWNSRHGHGDALHLGKFDPSRKGLQIWSCFEACPFKVGAALRDARTGETIWDFPYSGDMGRCLVADIDPDSPGCEMWWYKGNAHSCTGADLGYGAGSSSMSYNMAVWFSNSLNRQLLDRSKIDAPKEKRVFTIYRYEVTTINSSKSNPCFYADIWGDWREEIIQVTSDQTELRLFTTWYPTDYKFPYLMSDHVYEMSALNQNIGYNQPTQLGYYLGSDLYKK